MLGKTGVPTKACAMMYKLVVQAVLLYGSKIWVVMDLMMTVLQGFHHRGSRSLVIRPRLQYKNNYISFIISGVLNLKKNQYLSYEQQRSSLTTYMMFLKQKKYEVTIKGR